MHIIMSFMGCIGSPMSGSGLDVLVASAFGLLTIQDHERQGMGDVNEIILHGDDGLPTTFHQ